MRAATVSGRWCFFPAFDCRRSVDFVPRGWCWCWYCKLITTSQRLSHRQSSSIESEHVVERHTPPGMTIFFVSAAAAAAWVVIHHIRLHDSKKAELASVSRRITLHLLYL